MKNSLPLALLALTVSICAPMRASADPVAIIVHPSNSVDDLSTAELVKIYRGERTRWRDGQKVLPINRDSESSVRRDFSRSLFNTAPEERMFHRQGYSGDTMITEKDEQTIELVSRIPNAIGYLYVNKTSTDKVKTVTINGFSPRDSGYSLK